MTGDVTAIVVEDDGYRCSLCHEWYHGKVCITVPDSAWKPFTKWLCRQCI